MLGNGSARTLSGVRDDITPPPPPPFRPSHGTKYCTWSFLLDDARLSSMPIEAEWLRGYRPMDGAVDEYRLCQYMYVAQVVT